MNGSLTTKLTGQRIHADRGAHLLELSTKGHIFSNFILVFLGKFLQITAKGFELFSQLESTFHRLQLIGVQLTLFN